MSKSGKKRAVWPLLFILIPLICAALALALLRPKGDPAQALDASLAAFYPTVSEDLTGPDAEIARAYAECFSLHPAGLFSQRLGRASGKVTLTSLDTELLTDGLADRMQELLSARAETAGRRSELYAAEGGLLPELARALYVEALEERLAHAEDYRREKTIPVTLCYRNGAWELDDSEALRAACKASIPSMPGYEAAVRALRPVALRYSLPLAGPGPVPDQACYGETSDPQVIAALLQSDTAQRLIGGQTLDFDPVRDMLGRPIYYYLDETILVVVWQQEEHGAVGTFAEVFISDASQLRRKLADDTFGTYQCYYATELAAQSNAVLACSGDYYNNGRDGYGLTVYEGQLMRCGLHYGQSLLFDGNGDMLFVYEDDFADEEAARRYIEENNVWFSLAWGPVLVDHGVDVTPYDYYYGEVLDTYARSVIGQLGKLHYLMMTINQEPPDYPYLATLRQAADSIIAHGCYNAYTLDGGQTASIILGGKLINHVQFGYERLVSDIFYFATALPEKYTVIE